jgi:hypothetical protein
MVVEDDLDRLLQMDIGKMKLILQNDDPVPSKVYK